LEHTARRPILFLARFAGPCVRALPSGYGVTADHLPHMSGVRRKAIRLFWTGSRLARLDINGLCGRLLLAFSCFLMPFFSKDVAHGGCLYYRVPSPHLYGAVTRVYKHSHHGRATLNAFRATRAFPPVGCAHGVDAARACCFPRTIARLPPLPPLAQPLWPHGDVKFFRSQWRRCGGTHGWVSTTAPTQRINCCAAARLPHPPFPPHTHTHSCPTRHNHCACLALPVSSRFVMTHLACIWTEDAARLLLSSSMPLPTYLYALPPTRHTLAPLLRRRFASG